MRTRLAVGAGLALATACSQAASRSSIFDVAPPALGCADDPGLQAGAPWPAEGGCAGRTSSSAALTPASPDVQWTLAMPEGYTPATAPVIAADGTLYVPSTLAALDRVRGLPALYAFAADGAEKWHFPLVSSLSPAIGADGTVYVVSPATLIALSPDGGVRWRFPVRQDAPGWITSPLPGADGVYLTAGQTLYALDHDGGLRWSLDTPGGWSRVAIGRDGTIYATSSWLEAIAPDGTVRWTAMVSSTGSDPVATAALVYVNTSDDTSDDLLAFAPNGAQRWHHAWPRPQLADPRQRRPPSPVVALDGRPHGDDIVAADGAGVLIERIGSGARHGHAFGGGLSAIGGDGGEMWTFDAGGTPTAPSIGADGTLYFGAAGKLYALGTTAGDGAHARVASANTTMPACEDRWAEPAITPLQYSLCYSSPGDLSDTWRRCGGRLVRPTDSVPTTCATLHVDFDAFGCASVTLDGAPEDATALSCVRWVYASWFRCPSLAGTRISLDGLCAWAE